MENYSMENLRKDFQEALFIARQAGYDEVDKNHYELALSNKWTKYLGQATRHSFHNFTVTLNLPYAKIAPHEEIMNTLVHEVGHTCEGCMNHGNAWKTFARKVYAYNGMNISRLAEKSTAVAQYIDGRNTSHPTYRIVCENCGNVCIYHRRGKVFDALLKINQSGLPNNRFSCGACHSKRLVANFVK